MGIVIWMGVVTTLLGLAGLIWCIRRVLKARKKGLDDAALRGELQRAVAFNLASLLLSALGLMMVIVGIMLS